MADGAEHNGKARSHRFGHIDEKWPEVMFINDHAVFMGYLSMAVTGTGLLVLTWSTVVLLGGFVTMLAKKDFWSLTVITLVQTRTFDVFLNGNISYLGYSLKRLWKAALSIAIPRTPFKKWSARGLIRVLVFTTVLCPLFALYMFGLFVSPLISLWRLVEQDFGDTAGDSSKANLKPALVVLYSLAMFQGVLFCYKAISSLEEQRLLNLVAREYLLKDDDEARESLSDYLRETRVGCEKNPSFARGRNLVTYAAELMQSNYPENYLSGARILDTLIGLPESDESRRTQVCSMFDPSPSESESESEGGDAAAARASGGGDAAAARTLVTLVLLQEPMVQSQRMLINNMIGGSTSSGAINKLVQMLDSRSRHDSTDIRSRAMRIVAYFASEIRLNNVPCGIQCISSFLDNSEARVYKHTSIDILLKLTNDKENLRIMSTTSGLAFKIIKLLDDPKHGKLSDRKHDKWCPSIGVPGMEVIKRFIMSVATTRTSSNDNDMQLPREMLENEKAMKTLQTMLDCSRCKVNKELQSSVIVVVTQIISMDTSLDVRNEVAKKLIALLIDFFLDNGSSLKKLAGESLAQLSLVSENSANLILETKNGVIVDALTKVVVDVKRKDRKSAADILKHLCSHYRANGNPSHFEELKNAMIDQVIPKALREVLGCMSTAEPSPSSIKTLASFYRPLPYYYPYQYSTYNVEVNEALWSLCATVHARLIREEPNLAPLFEKIATDISNAMRKEPSLSFDALVKEAAQVVADKRRSRIRFSDEADPNSCCVSCLHA